MSENPDIRLTDEQFEQLKHSLSAQVSEAHHHLNEQQVAMLSEFSNMLADGGMDKMRTILSMADKVGQFQKAGIMAITTVLVGGVFYALWLGALAAGHMLRRKVLEG